MTLSDGRTLGFAEYGDPQGQPIMYFHGWPSSRLEAGMVGPAALKHHVRIIAPDRPGFGRSEFKPGRALGDWPHDVIELANALELDRFAVLGISGGGPYVAACAGKIPQRLRAAGMVSGLAPADVPGAVEGMRPLNRRLLQVGRRAPWLFGLLAWGVVRALRRDPDRFLARQFADLPQPDREILARPEIRKHIQDAALEAFRTGSRGAALENALYARSWGFRLQDITTKVHLWQGELDINVPPAMGRYLAKTIPNCCSRFYAAEGHTSLLVNHMEDILCTLSSESGG
jgi:pimeloyl-ACP methyl ester carboxylesterase